MAESNNSGASREPRYAYYADDEISLVDLWRILVARKVLIIFIVLFSGLTGAIASYIVNEEFESRATIHIGLVSIPGATTMGPLLFENPEEMSARIKQTFDVDPYTGSFLHEVSTGRRGAEPILTLVARGPAADASVRYLETVLDQILAEHLEHYISRVDRERAYLTALSSQIDSLEQNLGELSETLPSINAMSTQERLEMERMKVQLLELKGNYVDREMLISPPFAKQTVVLARPGESGSRVKPNPPLYIAVAFLLGGMLGIFAAFFAEFLKNARTSDAA